MTAGSRIGLGLLVGAVVVAGLGAMVPWALACPFCSAVSLTFTEEINNSQVAVIARLVEPPPKADAPFYVTLEKKADGTWTAVRVTQRFPQDAGPDRVALKGRLQLGTWSDTYVWPRYGIESYFVPQGEGLRLEALAREKKLAVLVAVDKAGEAAIKGLIVDGKLQYEEPLF